ncbi:uncharacterized protein [Amphiura filiformis]|uniref:uncharacterized protein n=1 Tax=Amphiura filiformis TaxID=82378 RepID=UPI003B223BAC
MTLIKKCKKTKQDLHLAMLNLRATPVDTGIPSPAELLFGRPKKTHERDGANEKLKEKKRKMKQDYDKHAGMDLDPLYDGQRVRVLNSDNKVWQPAVVTGVQQEPRSYELTTPNGSVLRRNRAHIRGMPQSETNKIQPRKVRFEDEPINSPSPKETSIEKQKPVPNPPLDVSTVNIEATRITLGWNDPDGSNGDIILYHVDYRPIQTSTQNNNDLSNEKFTNDTLDVRGDSDIHHEYVLHDLIPDAIYEVYVSAENAAGIGKAERHVFFTKSTEASSPCSLSPCQNSGQCTNIGNSYSCSCMNGFSGINCENVASIPGSPSGLSAGAAAGVSIAVILIIIIVVIVVICIRKRERNDANTPDEVRLYKDRIVHEETRTNPSFAFDVEGYEDINDQDYEYMKSSKWDVAWQDLNLSGQILGKGNFGEVQLGKVRIKGRWMKAAVKTLKDGTPDSEKALFKEEFATMTRIGHHPNVVNILGSCEYAGSLYVILEYVPHGNLRKFLRKSRMQMPAGGGKPGRVVSNLNPDQLLKFAVGVAEAMKHISATGIIHRDLAARNVLVGKGLTSKVADFGMYRKRTSMCKLHRNVCQPDGCLLSP